MSRQATRVSTGLETTDKPVRKRSKKLRVFLIILALLLAYALFDLYGPRSSKMRSFDANEVARLETAMWKSYYSR